MAWDLMGTNQEFSKFDGLLVAHSLLAVFKAKFSTLPAVLQDAKFGIEHLQKNVWVDLLVLTSHDDFPFLFYLFIFLVLFFFFF